MIESVIFFFSGSATNFSDFLRSYSKIEGVENHQLILHDGIGEAKSPILGRLTLHRVITPVLHSRRLDTAIDS